MIGVGPLRASSRVGKGPPVRFLQVAGGPYAHVGVFPTCLRGAAGQSQRDDPKERLGVPRRRCVGKIRREKGKGKKKGQRTPLMIGWSGSSSRALASACVMPSRLATTAGGTASRCNNSSRRSREERGSARKLILSFSPSARE